LRHRDERGGDLRSRLAPLVSRLGEGAPPIRSGLGGARESVVSFSLLHHALYEIERATDERDAQRLRDAFAVARASEDFLDADGAFFLAFGAGSCRRTDDERFGSTVYSVSTQALAADDHRLGELVEQATEAVIRSGYERYLVYGLGIVVLCERSERGGTAFSYSLGAFPYTVFTDWADDATILGECLVHEGAHSWLNAALAAAGERLPPEPLAYSPWKETERPAYGLIHAGLAFSILTSYFRFSATSELASDDTRRYCEIREDVERRRVTLAREGLERALSCLKSEEIAEVIVSEMANAMDASAVVGA